MVVPLGIRYFRGTSKSSVRYQPPMLTPAGVGLRSSMESYWGGSVWVSISLMTMAGVAGPAESTAPGEPLSAPLARQLVFKPQVVVGAAALTITSENPAPSVPGYHPSS